MVTRTTFTADQAHDRMRLDVFVSARLTPEYSRSQAARMIKAGLVTVNGTQVRASSAVRAGDRIEIKPLSVPTTPQSSGATPEIEVLFADDELIVINKAAGMTVHPAPGHPDATLADALLARFPEMATMAEPDGVLRPGIVHRLDRETSGVMVVARTPFSKTALSRQFNERTVRKTYIAVVRGVMARDRVTISRPIGRHPTDRIRMSVASRNPRAAVSHVAVLNRFPPRDKTDPGATLVCVRPETGRTHQIRVHLASIGHPCLGDLLYGGRVKAGAEAPELMLKRQALHALAISFMHPRTGARLQFSAPLPPDFSDLLGSYGCMTDSSTLTRWIDIE